MRSRSPPVIAKSRGLMESETDAQRRNPEHSPEGLVGSVDWYDTR